VNREERQQEVDHLREEFLKGTNAYLVEFAGLKVGQVNDLRRRIRGASGRYRVVKNRLAIRAAEGTPLAGHATLFDGPTAVAYSPDPVALAKVLAEFQKSNPIKVKGLVLEGKALPATALEGIVNLPSRPELISRFAGMLRSPLVKFVMLLKAPVRDFASVVRQVAEKRGSGGPQETAAPPASE
jgi:large subunit ribosomal protein L10